jgi:hypothetical protein
MHSTRVPRRTFWSKKKEVMCGGRKLHNEKFHNLYTALVITSRMDLEHCMNEKDRRRRRFCETLEGKRHC